MNQSSRDHTLQGVRPSPGPGRGAVSSQSSRDKQRKRSLPGSTVRREGRAISSGAQRPATDLMTVREVLAELNGVSRDTFYRWRQLGVAPPAIRLPNGELRIKRAEFLRWLDSLPSAA